VSIAGQVDPIFPSRAKREEYEREHPIPDTFEDLSVDENFAQHNRDEGHHRITREKEGRPVRWCVTCHVPLVMGWYCGVPTQKKKHPPCRIPVYEEGAACGRHNTPEKLAALATRKRKYKEVSPEQRKQKKERQQAKYQRKKKQEGKQVRQHYYPGSRSSPTQKLGRIEAQHVTSTSQVRQTEGTPIEPIKQPSSRGEGKMMAVPMPKTQRRTT
jgi:hypothetical protein